MSDSFPIVVPFRIKEAARIALTSMPPGTPLPEFIAKLCEIAAEAIAVERVGVWLYIDQDNAIHCVDLYEKSRGDHSNGALIQITDFPRYFATLNIRKSVPAEIAATDPATSELTEAYLRPLGITSMLDAGVFLEGKLVGVVCHEHVGPPREWTTEDRDFASAVADQLALRMQSAEVEELKSAFRNHEERIAAIGLAESMANMVSGVIHDFRNLLTIVLGNADVIRTSAALNKSDRECLDMLIEAAQRGVDLSLELLQFARPTSYPPTVINLADAVREFLPLMRSSVGPRHAIEYETQGQMSPILVDKGQLQRVLLNLVLNARDAMADGGTIRISVQVVKLREEGRPFGSYVMLTVTDHGCGMDESTLKRCHEPFFTTKDKGTGVGLAIVRKLVDRAGGILKIESRPGQGTAIRVFYPRIGSSTGDTLEHPALP